MGWLILLECNPYRMHCTTTLDMGSGSNGSPVYTRSPSPSVYAMHWVPDQCKSGKSTEKARPVQVLSRSQHEISIARSRSNYI
jgi:hypothetical protein